MTGSAMLGLPELIVSIACKVRGHCGPASRKLIGTIEPAVVG